MSDTTKTPRVTKRERELLGKLEAAEKRIDELLAQLAKLNEVAPKTSELVEVSLRSNGSLEQPLATELHIGDTVLTAPDGAIVTRSKSTTVRNGKTVPTSYTLSGLRVRFNAEGKIVMPSRAVPTFIERAQAVGWKPAN